MDWLLKLVHLYNFTLKKFTIFGKNSNEIGNKLQDNINFEIANGGCRDKCQEFKLQYLQNQQQKKDLFSDPEFIKVKKDRIEGYK